MGSVAPRRKAGESAGAVGPDILRAVDVRLFGVDCIRLMHPKSGAAPPDFFFLFIKAEQEGIVDVQRGGDLQQESEGQIGAVLAALQTADDAWIDEYPLRQLCLRETAHAPVVRHFSADLPEQQLRID